MNNGLNMNFLKIPLALVLILIMSQSGLAHAYVGPGIGLTAFGSLAALVVAGWYLIKGLFWLPICHFLSSANAPKEQSDSEGEEDSDELSK